ncbi:MAG: hypothetical protein PHH98_03435 [Candidatus Gracilibacteria bacterium]|nr:hypothetical protein [Candidatus Gracilibacteria bacterium]
MYLKSLKFILYIFVGFYFVFINLVSANSLTNPYSTDLNQVNKLQIDNLVTSISTKKLQINTEKFNSFTDDITNKLSILKSKFSTNKNVLNTINYLSYEINQLKKDDMISEGDLEKIICSNGNCDSSISNSNNTTITINSNSMIACGDSTKNDYTTYGDISGKIILNKEYCNSKGGEIWAICDGKQTNLKSINSIKDGENFNCNNITQVGTTQLINTNNSFGSCIKSGPLYYNSGNTCTWASFECVNGKYYWGKQFSPVPPYPETGTKFYNTLNSCNVTLESNTTSTINNGNTTNSNITTNTNNTLSNNAIYDLFNNNYYKCADEYEIWSCEKYLDFYPQLLDLYSNPNSKGCNGNNKADSNGWTMNYFENNGYVDANISGWGCAIMKKSQYCRKGTIEEVSLDTIKNETGINDLVSGYWSPLKVANFNSGFNELKFDSCNNKVDGNLYSKIRLNSNGTNITPEFRNIRTFNSNGQSHSWTTKNVDKLSWTCTNSQMKTFSNQNESLNHTEYFMSWEQLINSGWAYGSYNCKWTFEGNGQKKEKNESFYLRYQK